VLKRRGFIAAIATWRGQDDNPEVQHKYVVADDWKQAELKSGLVADQECKGGPPISGRCS